MANRDLVRIHHPGHPGVESEVSLSAFEKRSSKLGWVPSDSAMADDYATRETPESANPGEPGMAHRETLVAEATALGLKVHHRAKDETIQRQIDDAKAAR